MEGGGEKGEGIFQLEMRKGSDLFQYIYFDNFEGGYSPLTVCARFREGK